MKPRPRLNRIFAHGHRPRLGVLALAGVFLAGGVCPGENAPTHGTLTPADDAPLSWYKRWTRNVAATWRSSQWEIHIPLRIWHDRKAYDGDISRMNEEPWGAGAGKIYHDEKRNRHSLFVMGFQDSHNEFEPIAGYTWQKLWRNEADTWRFSLGYMAGITMRGDVNYIPFPLAMPIVGVEYRRLSIEFTYIPPLDAVDFTGSAFFVWARWRL